MSVLLFTYKALFMAAYFFISFLLISHQLIARWLAFSAGFALLYVVGGLLLFDQWPITLPIPIGIVPTMVFLVGSPLLLGLGLVRGMSISGLAGTLVALGGVVFLLMLVSGLKGVEPTGVAFLVAPRARYLIEVGALAALVLGIPAVIGYGLARQLTGVQIAGLLGLVATLALPFLSAVYLVTGFETVQEFIRLNPDLFHG